MRQHPIYKAALAAQQRPGATVSISLTDTAKCVRATLKAAYPDTKFSVRCDRYSGASSIYVKWMDGPIKKDVNTRVGAFASKSFDSMIDLSYSVGAWLYPDGSASFRESEGTTSSGGVYPASSSGAADGDAIPVHFGSGYVSCSRRRSVSGLQADMDAYAKAYSNELAEMIRDGRAHAGGDEGYAHMVGANHVRVDDQWASDALWRFITGADGVRKAATS